MRVAFVTDTAHPDLTADDRLAVDALAARGVEVVPAVWGRPLPAVAHAVVRSPWDYYHDLPAFLAWIEGLCAPVSNPPALLRWNAEKTYLFDLAARAVPIVPTTRVRGGGSLAEALAEVGAAEVVVKPEVSGGGFATWRLNAGDRAAVAQVEEGMAAVGGWFHVQPFLASVLDAGELSLVWLGGRFSHALAKRPAPGNFLVQEEHGGGSVAVDAPRDAVAAGERALDGLGELLYARVDLLRDGGAWRLVELELVEPDLFLRLEPRAPSRFAEALLARVDARLG